MNPSTERALQQLSDAVLLRSASQPRDGQMVKVRPGSNRVLDGNTRVRELQRRMHDPSSIIKPDTLIPVDEDF